VEFPSVFYLLAKITLSFRPNLLDDHALPLESSS